MSSRMRGARVGRGGMAAAVLAYCVASSSISPSWADAAASDSMFSLAGTWRRDTKPRERLFIRAAESGHGWVVFDETGLRATVLGTEGGYAGPVRILSDDPLAAAPHGALLKLKGVGEHRIEVQLEPQGKASPSWIARFSRSSLRIPERVPSPRKGAFQRPPGQWPRLGEYVRADSLPVYLRRVAPRYPDAAREAEIQGTVIVQALISTDGLVKKVVVSQSVPGLDEAAASAIRQWRFRPAIWRGEPITIWAALPVKFSLN